MTLPLQPLLPAIPLSLIASFGPARSELNQLLECGGAENQAKCDVFLTFRYLHALTRQFFRPIEHFLSVQCLNRTGIAPDTQNQSIHTVIYSYVAGALVGAVQRLGTLQSKSSALFRPMEALMLPVSLRKPS